MRPPSPSPGSMWHLPPAQSGLAQNGVGINNRLDSTYSFSPPGKLVNSVAVLSLTFVGCAEGTTGVSEPVLQKKARPHKHARRSTSQDVFRAIRVRVSVLLRRSAPFSGK